MPDLISSYQQHDIMPHIFDQNSISHEPRSISAMQHMLASLEDLERHM